MARAAISAWQGAIDFGGFGINLRAYNLIQSRSAQSFKNLCPCHQQPVVMPKRCPVDGTEVNTDECAKGHQVSRGNIVVVPPEAVEQIKNAESTQLLEIKQLPKRDSVHELALATQHYRLVPNSDVPGSEQPAQILWNGLHASERVLVTEWVPRAGSRDSLLVVDADEFGLTGHVVPYASEIKDTAEFKPVPDERAAGMFEAFATQAGISMDSFHHADFESAYEARRRIAIEAALSGEPIPAGAAPTKAAAVPDLMALMSAAVEEAKATKKPAPKKPAPKPAAKKPRKTTA